MCITASSVVCGCVHCTMSDSHSRKFPGSAHIHTHWHDNREDFTLRAHTHTHTHCSLGSPYLVLVVFVFCMVTHYLFAPGHWIPCDSPEEYCPPLSTERSQWPSTRYVTQRLIRVGVKEGDKLAKVTHHSLCGDFVLPEVDWKSTHVGAGCGVGGGRFLCRSRACGWTGPAASCSSPSPSPPSPPGRCKSEEGTSLSVAKRQEWITQSVGGTPEDGNMLSFTLPDSHLLSNNAFYSSFDGDIRQWM